MQELSEYTIVRFHCPKCRRFLSKFALNDIELLMLPCSNCKHMSAVRVKNQNIYYKLISKSDREPDGVMGVQQIDEFLESAECIKHS